MTVRLYIGAALLILGAIVMCISMLGVFRFDYVLSRMHASAITDTLGSLLIIVGLVVIRGLSFASLKLILILLVLWITSPVCTNRLAAADIRYDDEYKKHCEVDDK